MNTWVDTHCHLDAAEFAIDRDSVYTAARSAGVETFIVPAVEVANFTAVRDCCRRYPGCLPAYGIHPLYVQQAVPQDLVTLREWIERENPVAIGEIGLDFYTDEIDPVQQEYFFVEQLKMARTFDLPVLLHVRRSVDAVLKQIRRIGGRGIAHAFNGSQQQANEFIRLGFKLGFGGAMSYLGSTRIRKLAATLPLEALLLETDAPDMAPVWLPRGRNSPAELPRLAGILAELRGVTIADIAVATRKNLCAILPNLTENA